MLRRTRVNETEKIKIGSNLCGSDKITRIGDGEQSWGQRLEYFAEGIRGGTQTNREHFADIYKSREVSSALLKSWTINQPP